MGLNHSFGMVFVFSAALVVNGCQSSLATNEAVRPIANDSSESTIDQVSKNEILETYDIANSKGLISLYGKHLRLYNEDRSLWFELSLANEETARASVDGNHDFRPFRRDTDDWSIHFNYVGQDRRYYHVIVNDETGLKKFIKKDDQNFKTGTWEQYILNCFAVQFDSESNPLRDQPNGDAQGSKPNQWTCRPKEIRGEWLKIGWHESDDVQLPINHGWIKWKSSNKIVVGLFEIA